MLTFCQKPTKSFNICNDLFTLTSVKKQDTFNCDHLSHPLDADGITKSIWIYVSSRRQAFREAHPYHGTIDKRVKFNANAHALKSSPQM